MKKWGKWGTWNDVGYEVNYNVHLRIQLHLIKKFRSERYVIPARFVFRPMHIAQHHFLAIFSRFCTVFLKSFD